MARKPHLDPTMYSIVMVDSVRATAEMKAYGRDVIAAKIHTLHELVEFCFVYKLKGIIIGHLGDGFLVLAPPDPPKVVEAALSCMRFIRGHNVELTPVETLNIRIAIHYGLVAPAHKNNYADPNLNYVARLENATPPNTICISAVLHDIVADTMPYYSFKPMKAAFQGLGETPFYALQHGSDGAVTATDEATQMHCYVPPLTEASTFG